MQGDDGTVADAVDVIQKFASKCEEVELKDESDKAKEVAEQLSVRVLEEYLDIEVDGDI